MPERPVTMLSDGPEHSAGTLVLAHGAGAGMRSTFMEAFAHGLAARHIRVCRFEFPYMREMTATGRRRPPNPAPTLIRCWQEIIARFERRRLFIGGKSLGGRIASMVADEGGVAGLVCLGYPFHPPGRPEKPRTEHLRTLKTPTLICQGTRDPFGSPGDVAAYALSPAIRLQWLPDGNHSLEPRRTSGRTTSDNWREAMDSIAEFIAAVAQPGGERHQ